MKNFQCIALAITIAASCSMASLAQTNIPVVTVKAKTAAASGFESDRHRRVVKPYATVRANRNGFFIGTLFKENPRTGRADQFNLLDVRGGWAAGKAPTAGKPPVWVQLDRLDKRKLPPYKGSPTPILTKEKSRKLLLKNYASKINPKPKDGSEAPLNKNARLYLNLDFKNGKGLDPHPVVLQPNPNRRIMWRWMTDDRKFLAVRTFLVSPADPKKRITRGRWGFVRCTSVNAKLNGKSLPCKR